MAVTPNLGLASPLISGVAGWIARIKSDLVLIDQAFGGAGGAGNLLVNPGFELNQRGAASYTGHGAFTLDRWQISYQGAVTLTVSPEVGTVDAHSAASAKCVFVLGAGTVADLEQTVEHWAVLKGVTVSFSQRVKCSTANAVRLIVNDGVTPAYSAYHTGGGGWETLAVTRTLDAAATTLRVGLVLSVSTTAYADNASLVLGGTPLPYAPLHPADDVRRCERYYEVHGGASGYPYVRGYSAVAAGDVATVATAWRERKGGLPTVTKAGTWGINNAAQPTIPNANADGYLLQIASLATGYFDAGPNGSDDLIIGEWNP